jgi:hypothetical protein
MKLKPNFKNAEVFSVYVNIGGARDYPSLKERGEDLKAAGIPFKRCSSCYVGMSGFLIPKVFKDKASDILFGK